MAFKIYKKGQGYYTRMGTALSSALISALGCYSLYLQLSGIRTGGHLTTTVKAWIQAGIPTILFAVLSWLIYKAVNITRFADFLIATEGEMKKVNWTSKKELIVSTKVVLVTVFLIAVLLAVVDYCFANIFQWIGVLEVISE